jgi:hypothetical protein
MAEAIIGTDRATHVRDTAGLEQMLLDDARRREYGKILDAAGVKGPGDTRR